MCLETVSTFCVKSTKDELEENQTNALKLERPTSTAYYVRKTTVRAQLLLKLVYVLGHISHYDGLLCIESGGLASSRVVRHPVL